MDGPRSAKRIKCLSGACPLPDDIVEEILSRLPVKSLLRFRCVSRRFHATITSSHVFQHAHFLQRNNKRRVNPPRLFIRPPFGPRQPLYAWQWHPRRPWVSGPVEEIMTTSRLPQGTIFPVASKSCHGLVLLKSLVHHTHYVWNPSTRHILPLPDTDNKPATYGLGYCSATRRHKVVRVYLVAGDCCYYPATVCEVLALDDPSPCWRPPAAAMTPPPPHWRSPRENWRRGAVLCNGNLHFLQEDGDIVTFNVTDESFGMSSLKPPPELQSCDNLELAELDGCLCVYTFTVVKWLPVDEEFESPTCEIWVMREAGSWEKLCSIDWESMLPPYYSNLSWFWITPLHMFSDGNDEKKKNIIFAAGTGHVFVFDPSVGSLEIIFSPDDGAVGEYNNYSNGQVPTVGLFEESLALVGNTSENITFSQP